MQVNLFKYFVKYGIILIERYGDDMPSRMERYYNPPEKKSRASKNKELYRTIYDEVEYSNVEGISVIEKNEKIDINKIRELINGTKEVSKPKPIKEEPVLPVIEDEEEEKSYDIRDVLDKAKSERQEKTSRFANTQYNILKGISLDKEVRTSLSEDDLKNMIETISNNSKNRYTTDLLDDLKSIHDPNLARKVEEKVEDMSENDDIQSTKLIQSNIDKSFFTSSLEFSSDDFDDFKEMKETIKKNNVLTKVLLFILLVIIIMGVLFLIYHFTQK